MTLGLLKAARRAVTLRAATYMLPECLDPDVTVKVYRATDLVVDSWCLALGHDVENGVCVLCDKSIEV